MSPPETWSDFGERMKSGSGITELMRDLGEALEAGGDDIHMLGGGNPAKIPAIRAVWQRLMRKLLDADPDRFDSMLGNYDPAQGNTRFLDAVADLFNTQYGWNLTRENIAITNGGQTAFFTLFNILAGSRRDGGKNRILFPMTPEYIGYADLGFEPGTFTSCRPQIETHPDGMFKYRVDFDALPWDDDIAAACLSRPTNPTANVVTDEELSKLHAQCLAHDCYLIVDNAYGTPFPNMVFADAVPFWGENVILTYSLSKLGLPGTRTGIVIGPPDVIAALANASSIIGLANGAIGQALTLPLFLSGDITRLCAEHVRPFYQSRCTRAVAALRNSLPPSTCRIHLPEGALFLWLWFPDLPVTDHQLYQKFKHHGILVVPGCHFFHSLHSPWPHSHQCLRINYSHQTESLPDAAAKMADIIQSL